MKTDRQKRVGRSRRERGRERTRTRRKLEKLAKNAVKPRRSTTTASRERNEDDAVAELGNRHSDRQTCINARWYFTRNTRVHRVRVRMQRRDGRNPNEDRWETLNRTTKQQQRKGLDLKNVVEVLNGAKALQSPMR